MTGMRYMNRFTNAIALGALVASTVSCGDVVRSGKSPSFLVIDLLQGQRGGTTGTLGVPLISDVLSK